jgi:RNase P/RNase MRP subunit POP5
MLLIIILVIIIIIITWNVKTKVIPVIIGTTGTISKSVRKYVSNQEITKLRNYRKQRYWALHTYCGKC